MKNVLMILGLLAFLSQPVMAQSASPSDPGSAGGGASYGSHGGSMTPGSNPSTYGSGNTTSKKHRFRRHKSSTGATSGSPTGGASNVRGYW